MSNKEALDLFVRKHVTTEMVDYLVSTTKSIIKVKTPETEVKAYPSPPGSPEAAKQKKPISLKSFIINLIRYSNVQVPTLMGTLVYLNRLKEILPSDQIYGIATTHHRIFVGCLILTAKYVNDSSPLNKHWARYSSGLLSVKELNVIEVEVLSYLDWDLSITNDDLYSSLSLFLAPIKTKLRLKEEEELLKKQQKQEQMKLSALAKPSFKSLKSSASLTSLKKMLCPPSATSSTFSDNTISPTSTLSQSLSNNSSVSSISSPVKNITTGYPVPSLTNSASTYQSNSSSAYSLNNSSTSSLTKKMIEDDFSFVQPPAKQSSNIGDYSPMSNYMSNQKPQLIFSSPKNLLSRITSRNSSPKQSNSPRLYRIASNTSMRSNSSTSKLMSPINSLKNKVKRGTKLSKMEQPPTLAQPPTIHKNIKVSVSSDNLRHFNLANNATVRSNA